MSNVVRIRRKEKEQEKKQLLSLITMDEFLLSKQKDDIVAEVNSILMDESRAFFLESRGGVRCVGLRRIGGSCYGFRRCGEGGIGRREWTEERISKQTGGHRWLYCCRYSFSVWEDCFSCQFAAFVVQYKWIRMLRKDAQVLWQKRRKREKTGNGKRT